MARKTPDANNTSSLPGRAGWEIEVGAVTQGSGEDGQRELLIPIPVLGGAPRQLESLPTEGAIFMIQPSSCQPQVSSPQLPCAGTAEMNKVWPLLGVCGCD